MKTLLTFLLNHMLFAGTLFAAAGTSLGVGGGSGAGSGAGSSGANSSGGAGAGSSGEGTGAGEGGAGGSGDGSASGAEDLSAGAGEGGEEGESGRADASGQVDDGTGRKVPANINKLFEAAKALGIEKDVRQLYFANERLTKAVGGVNQAIALKKEFDKLGGVQGIQDLQSELETHTQDAELFESGDANWVKNAFTENPEQTLKHFDHALEYVSEHHQEHYDHCMAQVVVETLNGKGSPIGKIYNLLVNMKDKPEAAAIAEQLGKWYNSLKNTANKPPEKRVDAREKALNERSATVDQKEVAQRYTQINATVFPQMRKEVQSALEGEAKLVNADLTKIAAEFPGAFQSMLRDIHEKIKNTATKDQRFVNKYSALVKKGDTKRAAETLTQKHASIIHDIVVDIAGKSGLLKKKAAAAAAGAGGQGEKGTPGAGSSAAAGFTQVSAKPANHLIDYRKTTSAMQMDGKYILKDGKSVQVKY